MCGGRRYVPGNAALSRVAHLRTLLADCRIRAGVGERVTILLSTEENRTMSKPYYEPWVFERVWQAALILFAVAGVLIFALYNPIG